MTSCASLLSWRGVFLGLFLGAAGVNGFDMVNSGAQGLSPQCAAVVGQLQAGMTSGDPKATTTVLEALYATGRVIEGLFILNAGAKAPPPSPEEQKEAVLNIVTGYPWSSLGSADSCGYITTDRGALADFQYCYIDVAGAYLRYGLCVPQACTPDDIMLGLNTSFTKIAKTPLDPSLQLAAKTVCGNPKYTPVTGTYVMIVVTCLLLALVILGTTIEYLRLNASREPAVPELSSPGLMVDMDLVRGQRWFEQDSGLLKMLLCFSVIQNWRLLMAKARGGPFDSLDGIRSLSMGWVVFGHTFIFALFGVNFTNSGDVLGHDGKGWLTRYSAQALTGGYFAVDTFFFLSAFLAVYLMMEQVHKLTQAKGQPWSFVLKAPYIYVMRFVRLTPAYFYVILMYIFVLRLAGSGPFWKETFTNDIKLCSTGWWTNLLYVNNLVTQSVNGMKGQQCYPVAWYLGVDFQLFLLTPFVAAAGVWNHVATLSVLTISGILSSVLAVVYAYKNEWSIDFLDQSTYFGDYYIVPWFRAPPYLLGMGLAVVWFHFYRGSSTGVLPSLGRGGVRRDRVWVYSLLAVAFFLMGLTVYGAEPAYRDNPPPWDKLTMSVYIGLSKPAWTVGLALFCYLLFLGEGGLIKSFLECRAFTVLSRLTYCAYLVHPAIIYWTYGELLGPIHYTDEWYALTYIGVLSSVILVSTLVHLLVERPVANLERLLRGPDKGKGGKDFAKAQRLNGRDTEEEDEEAESAGNSPANGELNKPLLGGGAGRRG